MPPLEMVKVPPCSSSRASLPSRARAPKSAIAVSISAKTQVVGVAQDRHDKSALGADGNADMVVVLVDDIVTVDFGIDGRDFLQRLDTGLDEEAHQPELGAMLLLELLAVVAPKLHHRTHVHIVERGEHGGVVLRFLQPLGDGLT